MSDQGDEPFWGSTDVSAGNASCLRKDAEDDFVELKLHSYAKGVFFQLLCGVF